MQNATIGKLIGVAAVSGLAMAAAAASSETVTYSYDARGRLVKVEHSGSINNGIVANYTLDKAENRTKVQVTGAP